MHTGTFSARKGLKVDYSLILLTVLAFFFSAKTYGPAQGDFFIPGSSRLLDETPKPRPCRARKKFLDLLVLWGKWSKFFTRPYSS